MDKYRNFCVVLFGLLVAGYASPANAKTVAKRPNILFVFIDDMGWKDPSFMGSDYFETPALDQLASEAMVFTNAYASASNCAPSRACLLSGQYTPRHQIYNVGTFARGKAAHRKLLHIPGVDVLDPEIVTWAQTAQRAGYRTGTIGKWHLSKDPLPYGFDVNIGGSHSGSPPKGYYPPHNVPGLRDAPQDEYLTDRLNNEAVKFIRESRDKPWLLYLTHFAVHTPLNAKKELLDKYKTKKHGKLHKNLAMATMIQSVDDGVKQLFATLKELDLADNTITIFYSDNGGYVGATDMTPLRGHKGTYYEGGIRVPFFVHWPGVVKSGKSHEPVIGVDLYPTLCSMMAVKPPTDQVQDGVDLVPYLRGEVESLTDRAIYWHFPAYLQAGSGSPEPRDVLFRSRPCSIIRRGDWKLHEYFEDGGIELYNLRDDIGEANDLSKSNPDMAHSLVEQLRGWRAETKAPVPTILNPKYDAEEEAAAIANIRSRSKRK
jgi:arylsulfatase A-like enzyme